MSDAVERYWQDQADKYGDAARPSDDWRHPSQQEAAAQFEPPDTGAAQVQYEPGEDGYAWQMNQTPAESYDPALDYGGAEYDYEPPQPPDPLESDNYAQEFEQYLDARDAQRFENGVDLAHHQAEWEALQHQQQEQVQAQAEQQAIDDELLVGETLPQHIAQVPGLKGNREAAEMLAPLVAEHAEARGQQIVSELMAAGHSYEEAMQLLAPHYEDLIASSTATAQEAFGTQQLMDEFRAHFRGGQ